MARRRRTPLNPSGQRVAFDAARRGAASLIIQLHDIGFDLDIVDEEGRTLADVAAEHNRIHLLSHLTDVFGVPVDRPGRGGLTASHRVARAGHLEAASLLHALAVAAHRAPDPKAKDGRRPQHIAAAFGRTELLGQMHRAGLDLERLDAEHRTPLYHALTHNRPDTARFLLDRGVDAGWTCLNRSEAAALLESLPPAARTAPPSRRRPARRADTPVWAR
jgi:ankyrin repeat protein